jgi:addiction module HigA family antidote
MTKKELAPVTPGEMLKEEFLTEYGLSPNQLAKAIGISPNRITEIVNNRRRITADTALRLSLYLWERVRTQGQYSWREGKLLHPA